MPRRNVRRGRASAGGGRVGGGGMTFGKTTGVCGGSSRFFGGWSAFFSCVAGGAVASPFVVAVVGGAVVFASGTDKNVSFGFA